MSQDSRASIYRRRQRGILNTTLLVGAAICILVVAAALIYFRAPSASNTLDLMTVKVERGDFVAKVLDQGEIQSSENVEIRCEVRARNGELTVISLVPEGAQVKEGDFLVRLDSTSFEKERETQRIAVANAKAEVIQAKANLDTARTTLLEYEEGTYLALEKDMQNQIIEAEGLIKTSESELAQSQDVYRNSRELQAKGFITRRQLEADEFAVARAELALKQNRNALELAEKNKEVLIKYSKEKQLVQFRSDIAAAEVKLESQVDALKVQENQMAEIEEQILKCEIQVPAGVSGQVVYAKEQRGRGTDDWVLEEGATVRESQVLIRLPDTKRMEVKALVNEQNITQIQLGLPATIKVDALNSQTLKGMVTKVNQYAESSSWGSSSVRKYAVKVKIFDPPAVLKTGMNASCSIQTQFQDDALILPVQTVYGVQDRHFCLVREGDQYETREIKVGGNNSQMALILEGLSEGEDVVMNPGANKDLLELPEFQRDTKIEFSESQRASATKVAAEGAKAEAEQAKPENAGGGGMPDVATMVAAVMQRSDTNGDGKLDQNEVSKLGDRSKRWSSTADSDGDGNLSKDEVTKAMKRVMKARAAGGGRGGDSRPGTRR